MMASFALIYGLTRAMRRASSMFARRGGLEWRYAMGNLDRVGSAASQVLVALSIGTGLMVAIMLLEHNVMRQLSVDAAQEAPAFFVLDVPEEKRESFANDAQAIAGVGEVVMYPAIRGRITEIHGISAADAPVSADVVWAIRGDRVLSFGDTPPPGSEVIEGQWWPKDYKGEPQVSITKDLAQGMQLGVGDTLAVDVMGQRVPATIAAVREVDWRNYRMNFALIFSPNALQSFPHQYMATVEASAESEATFLRLMGRDYPLVAVVRLREALQDATRLVQQVAGAVSMVAWFALLMGAMVVTTALAASQQRRVKEHTIFKVLGATRRRIVTMLASEFLVLGVLSLLAAWLLGGVTAWLMVTQVFKSSYSLSAPVLFFTGVGCVLLAVITGLATSWKSLSIRPLRLLRNE
jgi:putative ABC transport system permease protein